MNPSASGTSVAASQLSVQLITAQFKGVGIVPVHILSFVLSISLTVGFLAPNQSVVPTFDPTGTLTQA
jgi:hypothetical protein